MLDDDLRVVANLYGCAGQELCIEGVELVWVRIRPQGHPLYAPYHPECVLKSIDNIITAEAIPLFAEAEFGGLVTVRANLLSDKLKCLSVLGVSHGC